MYIFFMVKHTMYIAYMYIWIGYLYSPSNYLINWIEPVKIWVNSEMAVKTRKVVTPILTNAGIIFFLLLPNVAKEILPTSAVSRTPLCRHRSLDGVRISQNMPIKDARIDLELILCVIRCTKKECHLGHSEFKISPRL